MTWQSARRVWANSVEVFARDVPIVLKSPARAWRPPQPVGNSEMTFWGPTKKMMLKHESNEASEHSPYHHKEHTLITRLYHIIVYTYLHIYIYIHICINICVYIYHISKKPWAGAVLVVSPSMLEVHFCVMCTHFAGCFCHLFFMHNFWCNVTKWCQEQYVILYECCVRALHSGLSLLSGFRVLQQKPWQTCHHSFAKLPTVPTCSPDVVYDQHYCLWTGNKNLAEFFLFQQAI